MFGFGEEEGGSARLLGVAGRLRPRASASRGTLHAGAEAASGRSFSEKRDDRRRTSLRLGGRAGQSL